MINKTILFGVLFGVLIVTGLTVNNAFAAAYIKFDGIDGEATDNDHQKWIELGSFSHTIAKHDAKTKRSVVDLGFEISKTLDKSSPKLQEAILTGKVFPKVQIDITRSFDATGASATYYKYELKNVQVTSYQISGAGQSSDRPAESLSLNFEEIKVTYSEYDDNGARKGNVEYSWKVEEGTK